MNGNHHLSDLNLKSDSKGNELTRLSFPFSQAVVAKFEAKLKRRDADIKDKTLELRKLRADAANAKLQVTGNPLITFFGIYLVTFLPIFCPQGRQGGGRAGRGGQEGRGHRGRRGRGRRLQEGARGGEGHAAADQGGRGGQGLRAGGQGRMGSSVRLDGYVALPKMVIQN